jgi:Flp pilus assembly protein TadG
MIEFAIVLILLITLLHELVTYGLNLSAQAMVTQAAADATGAGLVGSPSAVSVAEAQTAAAVGWRPRGGAVSR